MLKINLLKNVTTLYRKLPGASGSVPVLVSTSSYIPRARAAGVNIFGLKGTVTVARRADTHEEIGRLFVDTADKYRKHRGSAAIGVREAYQGIGIGTALFSNMLKNIKRFAPHIRFIHGSIVNPAQVSVRAKFKTQFYKAGYTPKAHVKRIGLDEAKREASGAYGAHAATMVDAKKRYQKVRFVRIRGRVVPIRRGSR